MTPAPSAYLAPGKDATAIHTTPDCGRLDHAIGVREVDPADHPDREPCSWCHDEGDADPYTATIPAAVPCPCGGGEATLRRSITPETTRPIRGSDIDGGTATVHYHYRHEGVGCPIGGTIVATDDRVLRRVGPLFDPGRYGEGPEAVATDGGGGSA